MNWDAIGAIAELLGAIGVIASLIYLATQIRQSREQMSQNSDLIRSQLSMAVRESRQSATRVIATDREASRVFWAGLESRSALSEDDRHQFDPLMALFTFGWEHEFELGEGVLRNYLVFQSAGYREWWQLYRSTYSEPFRKLIEERTAVGSAADKQRAVADSS